MRRLKNTLLTIPLLISSPALAATQTASFDQEITAFQKGDYNRSLTIGRYILQSNPGDVRVRYYCAQALMRMGRREEAKIQFKICFQNTTDFTMRDYCRQALKIIAAANRPATEQPVSISLVESPN